MATDKPEKFFYVHNAAELHRAVTAISKVKPTNDKPYCIKVSLDDESRSNKQNRLSFLWYRTLGKATGHGEEYERRRCKLSFGIPIMLEDIDFNAFYATAIMSLPYEQQLIAMDFVPVTSLMTMRQFAHYLDEMDRSSANQGIMLPKPEDLYWDALMKAVA